MQFPYRLWGVPALRSKKKCLDYGALIQTVPSHVLLEDGTSLKPLSLEFREEMEKLASTLGTSANRDAVATVESELEAIFGGAGKEVLLLEFSKRYNVVPGDAIRRPGAFHTALYYLLGELGSKFVMERISARVCGTVQVSPRVS